MAKVETLGLFDTWPDLLRVLSDYVPRCWNACYPDDARPALALAALQAYDAAPSPAANDVVYATLQPLMNAIQVAGAAWRIDQTNMRLLAAHQVATALSLALVARCGTGDGTIFQEAFEKAQARLYGAFCVAAVANAGVAVPLRRKRGLDA